MAGLVKSPRLDHLQHNKTGNIQQQTFPHSSQIMQNALKKKIQNKTTIFKALWNSPFLCIPTAQNCTTHRDRCNT